MFFVFVLAYLKLMILALLLWYRIHNMIRVIGRLIRAKYELRALETSIIAFLFNIMKDPW
jgi:hypothetical protein